MSLRIDAHTLCRAISGVVDSLATYRGAAGREYINDIFEKLQPLADAFRQAVFDEADRDKASEVLSHLQPVMEALNAATTKGDIPVFGYRDKSMEIYFTLYTIFRESRYRNLTL